MRVPIGVIARGVHHPLTPLAHICPPPPGAQQLRAQAHLLTFSSAHKLVGQNLIVF